MSILIKKNNSYHLVNETLYNELCKKELVCNNIELSILNEALSPQPDDFFMSFIPNEDRMLFATKDGKSYDKDKLFKLNDYVSNELNNGKTDVKSVISDYIENLKQEQQNALNQQQVQQSSQQQSNTNQQQSNNKNSQEKEVNTDNKENDNQNKELAEYAEKLNKTYVNLMKKWGMLEKINKKANQQDNKEYTIETIPVDKLLVVASETSEFRNKLLTTRFKNELNNLNISDEAKREIIRLYKDGEKKGNGIRNLLNSDKVKNHNDQQTIYNIPITEYYVEKYLKIKSNEIYNHLAKQIYQYLNDENFRKQIAKDNDKNAGIQSLIKEIGIKPEHSAKTIKIALKNRYSPESLRNLILSKGNRVIESDIINNIQGNSGDIKNDIYGLIQDLKETMRNVGLIRFIDYIITVNNFTATDLLNKTEETAKAVVRVRLFSDFNPSSIVAELMLDDDVKAKWKLEVPRKRISAIYDKSQRIIFSSIQNPEIKFAIEIVQGFMILDVIRTNYKKGQQTGQQILNYIKNR